MREGREEKSFVNATVAAVLRTEGGGTEEEDLVELLVVRSSGAEEEEKKKPVVGVAATVEGEMADGGEGKKSDM